MGYKLTLMDKGPRSASVSSVLTEITGKGIFEVLSLTKVLPAIIATDLSKEEAERYLTMIQNAGGVAEIALDGAVNEQLAKPNIDPSKDKFLSLEETAKELSRIFGHPFRVKEDGNGEGGIIIEGEAGGGLMFRAVHIYERYEDSLERVTKKEKEAIGYYRNGERVFANLFCYKIDDEVTGTKDHYEDINLTASVRSVQIHRGMAQLEEGLYFGTLDENGAPHGFGTISGNNATFIFGQYCHGVRNGFFLTCQKKDYECLNPDACIYDNGVRRPDLVFAQLKLQKPTLCRDWD